MMIVCTACQATLRVTGDESRAHALVGNGSEYWPDKFKCFRCDAPAHGFLEAEVSPEAIRVMTIVDVTAEEAYAAISGLGVPAERACSRENIQALFGSARLRAEGREIGRGDLFALDAIEFPDKTRVYFAPSPQGAVIYRVRPPHSYTDEVLRDAE